MVIRDEQAAIEEEDSKGSQDSTGSAPGTMPYVQSHGERCAHT